MCLYMCPHSPSRYYIYILLCDHNFHCFFHFSIDLIFNSCHFTSPSAFPSWFKKIFLVIGSSLEYFHSIKNLWVVYGSSSCMLKNIWSLFCTGNLIEHSFHGSQFLFVFSRNCVDFVPVSQLWMLSKSLKPD